MGDEQHTEAEVCSLEFCDLCLLCPVVLLAGGGTGSLFLLIGGTAGERVSEHLCWVDLHCFFFRST